MNTISPEGTPAADPLDSVPDAVAAAAFRRLVSHLRHRHDAQNIDLMGLAGFCRNCLADWINDAGAGLDKATAREVIHGMPAAEWKTLEAGCIQRVTALNRFLHDIYHEQDILKAGIIPAEQILTNAGYQLAMQGIDLPRQVYAHIAGVDIIRHSDGAPRPA